MLMTNGHASQVMTSTVQAASHLSATPSVLAVSSDVGFLDRLAVAGDSYRVDIDYNHDDGNADGDDKALIQPQES